MFLCLQRSGWGWFFFGSKMGGGVGRKGRISDFLPKKRKKERQIGLILHFNGF